VTHNDVDDDDTGANGKQNFPELTAATSSFAGTTITGSLASAADTAYLFELFGSTTCDPSDFGEGAWFVGSGVVQTDGTGLADFSLAVGAPVGGGRVVTVTATGPDGTSEFSECVEASGPVATTTTTTTLFPDTTITTTTEPDGGPGGSTTTTTLPDGAPRPCNVDADCVDADACTVDACGPGGLCVDDVLDHVGGVLCHVDNIRRMVPDAVCTGRCCRYQGRLQKLERRYQKAMESPKWRRCKRGLRRGRRHSRKLERKITRQARRGCIAPESMSAKLAAESTALNAAAEQIQPANECPAR